MNLLPDLFSFAYVPGWYCQLDELAGLALPEPWRFRNPNYYTKNTDTPILERYIHSIFKKQVIAFNRIWGKREEIIEAYHEVMEDNAQKAMDQAEYEKKYTRHYNRYEKARQRMAAIEELRLERNAKQTKTPCIPPLRSAASAHYFC